MSGKETITQSRVTTIFNLYIVLPPSPPVNISRFLFGCLALHWIALQYYLKKIESIEIFPLMRIRMLVNVSKRTVGRHPKNPFCLSLLSNLALIKLY